MNEKEAVMARNFSEWLSGAGAMARQRSRARGRASAGEAPPVDVLDLPDIKPVTPVTEPTFEHRT